MRSKASERAVAMPQICVVKIRWYNPCGSAKWPWQEHRGSPWQEVSSLVQWSERYEFIIRRKLVMTNKENINIVVFFRTMVSGTFPAHLAMCHMCHMCYAKCRRLPKPGKTVAASVTQSYQFCVMPMQQCCARSRFLDIDMHLTLYKVLFSWSYITANEAGECCSLEQRALLLHTKS